MPQLVISRRKPRSALASLATVDGNRLRTVPRASNSDGESDLVRAQCVQRFEQLRNEFGPVSRKIEALSRLACLTRPGFEQLASLARETSRLARFIDCELQLGTSKCNTSLQDLQWIENLVEECSDYQDRLQRQLGLVAQLREYALELRDELSLLAMRGRDRTGNLAFNGLRGLARQVISELVYDVSPPSLHPGLALDVLTELLGNRSDAGICSVALTSAQAVARVARVTWLREDQIELVTSAALLQDCGQFLTAQEAESSQYFRTSMRPDQHPLVGAAIVSGYGNAPAGLPMLIAQHHQRVNDGGRTIARGGVAQNEFSRLLATASRLERLRLRSARDSNLLTSSDLTDNSAMTQLWNEALLGDWDLEFTRKLLIQRDIPKTLQDSLNQVAANGKPSTWNTTSLKRSA